MKISNWLKSEVEYTRDLADSGWHGALAAWENMIQEEPVAEMFSRSARASWVPTVMGAGVGALCALLVQRRKPSPPVAVALGVVGGVVGFTAAVAWETRDLSSGVARGAMRHMTTTRDSHWLDKHPINFG
jgi:xanthosine utilization system XapX-like protein